MTSRRHFVALASLGLLAFWAGPSGAQEERKLLSIPPDHTLQGEAVFSKGGDRVAYSAIFESKTHVFLDGASQGSGVWADTPVFSADGQHFAFRLGDRIDHSTERWVVVVDGERGTACSWIGPLRMTPDGEPIYWLGKKVTTTGPGGAYAGGRYHVRWKGREGKAYGDGASFFPPLISGDGKAIAYVAVTAAKRSVAVIGGKQHKPHGAVEYLTLGRTARQYAYGALDSQLWTLYSSQKPRGHGAAYERIGGLSFDAKGRLLATVQDGKGWQLLQGGRAHRLEVTAAGRPVAGPKGQRVAVPVNEGGTLPIAGPGIPPGMLAGSAERIQDGVTGGKWSLWLDGKLDARTFDGLIDPRFAPKGGLVAFTARAGGGWRIVCGPHQSALYDGVGAVHWSEDGKTLSFGARRGRDLLWVTWKF